MKKIFLDTEFTGLRQDTTLVSIGLVSDCGKTFYAEFIDFDMDQIDGWLQENIVNKLKLVNEKSNHFWTNRDQDNLVSCGDKDFIQSELRLWLSNFDKIELWSDCLAYDWVLFCDLFGGAFEIPKNVYYIPFDLATVFKVKGVDPDIDREKYAFREVYNEMIRYKHTALWDAQVIKKCYEKLMKDE